MQPKTILIWQLIAASNGLTFLLNWLPVWLVMLFMFFCTGKAVLAGGVGALLYIIPAFINRYMIALRHAPLRPFDVLLGMEFLGVARSIRPAVYITAGLGFIFFIAFMLLGVRFFNNKQPSVFIRLTGAAVCLLVMSGLYLTVYSNPAIRDNLPIEGSIFSEHDQYQSKGFVYSFLYTWRNSRITKPLLYEFNKNIVEERDEEKYTGDIPIAFPNIIMVQSEAFSELALSNAVDFAGHDDPLRFYKTIKEESVHGYLITPHFGGGTSDMEFDILTGINTRGFRSVAYSFSMVTRPIRGFVPVLNKAGYDSHALHPGSGWFYNRQNVYPLLGFNEFKDMTVFDRSLSKGGYISEDHTVDVLIREYESRTQDPFFLKAITIQNHGPYHGKYNAQQNFNTQADLTANERNALANYFEGLKDSDVNLQRMVEYFRKRPEPVILIYYGDHLPSLPITVCETLIPKASGHEDPFLRFYRVPFIIWGNDKGREMLDISTFDVSLPGDRTISSFYLGAALLDMLGLGMVDPFFSHINSIRSHYPIMLENTFYRDDRTAAVFDIEDEYQGGLFMYQSWAYHRIMNP